MVSERKEFRQCLHTFLPRKLITCVELPQNVQLGSYLRSTIRSPST